MKNEMKRVPSLRFPEFSEEWESATYGDLYYFIPTNSLSRDNLNYEEGSVKNIHYGDIHTKFLTLFDIKKERVPFINLDVNLKKIKTESYCREGDLVIADASEDYSDIGKTIEIKSLGNEKVLAGLHTFLARPKGENMYVGFMSALLKSWSVRKQVMTIAQGTKVLGISTGRLSKINLSYPSLPEQTKIADFLSAIDARLHALEQKKSLLEAYKKGCMQRLFSQEIRFKDEDGKDFPEWEEKRLGEVFDRVKTKNSENNQNVLTISAQQGLVTQTKFFNSSVAAKDITGYYLIEKGDFAYNRSYSKGYPMGAIKRLKKHEKGTLSTLYICFRVREAANPEFFEQYFESGKLNSELSKIAQEGARNHGLLNMSVIEFFKDVKIFKPSLPEQEKIANFLSAQDKKIALLAEQIAHTKAYKKGLLQQMFV